MNETINLIKQHRSIRQYLDKDISEDLVDEVLKAAQAMPNSINGQQTSIIVVRDKEKKRKLSEVTGNQVYVDKAPVFLIFVMDFYKTNIGAEKYGRKQIIHESVEGTAAGVFDAGIAMGAAIIAAESLGLSVVPIGGIRRNPEEVIELLELPEFTYPVCGLVLGYAENQSKQKPRLPFETFKHEDRYHKEALKTKIDEYDEYMEKYLKEIGREQEGNWSDLTSSLYQTVYYPKVKDTMAQQGFKNDK
ncbi:NADPH-dependent oxidoreductase [Clostridium fungisolvens]|uniref:FMN reductase [NAD(P)H] n=1 Tax=Clostridium fungisolvens TaxID=1604897 RepID=A0A6V8SLD9_9CLOT|nr:NADPH-dependent oxidoreductase [Clostridium fungisolvens]GFP77997.1 FMN reductase [NAD(P)H] [Clostridium fungisolvens]